VVFEHVGVGVGGFAEGIDVVDDDLDGTGLEENGEVVEVSTTSAASPPSSVSSAARSTARVRLGSCASAASNASASTPTCVSRR
jgi:hypothetical protein